jgi:hypothetical protein
MSVVVKRSGREGVDLADRNPRKMCERTWGIVLAEE